MSSRPAVRIGRVRMRSGAEIRVLPGGTGGHADVNDVLQRFLGESRAGQARRLPWWPFGPMARYPPAGRAPIGDITTTWRPEH